MIAGFESDYSLGTVFNTHCVVLRHIVFVISLQSLAKSKGGTPKNRQFWLVQSKEREKKNIFFFLDLSLLLWFYLILNSELRLVTFEMQVIGNFYEIVWDKLYSQGKEITDNFWDSARQVECWAVFHWTWPVWRLVQSYRATGLKQFKRASYLKYHCTKMSRTTSVHFSNFKS